MDPSHYPEPSYPTYDGVYSQQSQPSDSNFELHRLLLQYPYSSATDHTPGGYGLPFSQQTTPYNLLTIDIPDTVWNQLPIERDPPPVDGYNSVELFSVQPQRTYLSHPERAVQTIQSDPISEHNRERPQARRQQAPLELVLQKPFKSSRHQSGFAGPGVIKFVVDGKEGVRLSNALKGNWKGFQGGDDRSLFGENRSYILIRLKFVGCQPQCLKILTADSTAERRSITRKKLVANVAKKIKKFMAENYKMPLSLARPYQGEQSSGHGNSRPQLCSWGDVSLENVFLSRVVHVAMASWQPEILVELPLVAS